VRYLTLFERRRSLERTKQRAAEDRRFAFSKGAEAFAILAESVAESVGVTTEAAHEDAALLWAGMHGYVTLRTSMPRFPWFADEENITAALVNRAISYAQSRTG
jgi:hypothetical protein